MVAKRFKPLQTGGLRMDLFLPTPALRGRINSRSRGSRARSVQVDTVEKPRPAS